MYACDSGDVGLVRLLTQAGADVTRVDVAGMTALSHACKRPGAPVALVVALLDAGAAVDPNCRGARSPVALAAEAGNVPVMRLLTERGANVKPE